MCSFLLLIELDASDRSREEFVEAGEVYVEHKFFVREKAFIVRDKHVQHIVWRLKVIFRLSLPESLLDLFVFELGVLERLEGPIEPVDSEQPLPLDVGAPEHGDKDRYTIYLPSLRSGLDAAGLSDSSHFYHLLMRNINVITAK